MNNIEFFQGFKWPVPTAFSDALSKCRFEQGDVLYSDICAYELIWKDALKDLRYSLQVSHPQRSTKEINNQNTQKLFNTNWNSNVILNIHDYKSNEKYIKTTYQGNLYMTMMEGDLKYINNNSVAELPLLAPSQAKDLDKFLSELEIEKTSKSQFLMIGDLTNDIHRTKKTKITDALAGQSKVKVFLAQSRQEFAGKTILPTLEIVVFDINLNIQDAEEAIKKAVYVPLKNKVTDRSNFRLSSHGILS